MEENKMQQEILDKVNTLSENMGALSGKVNTLSENMEFLVETVNFINDNAVTKYEFNEFREEVNGRFGEVNGRLDNIESELRSINTELTDIKSCLDRLEKRSKEDSDAHASDILELRQRVQMLERQVKQLQPAH